MMTQINANMPDGRSADAPRQFGAEITALALAITPTVEADSDLRLAREAVAVLAEREGEFTYAAFARRGSYDADPEVQIALTAVRLVRGEDK